MGRLEVQFDQSRLDSRCSSVLSYRKKQDLYTRNSQYFGFQKEDQEFAVCY